MTDSEEKEHSSDDEQPSGVSAAEAAALARKKRLLAMKSKIHGVEMKLEDYDEQAQPTKRAKQDEKQFRSYQPISEVLGKVETGLPDLNVLEREIDKHIDDTKDTTVIDTIDLNTLAPKKIDWDLKRDIEKKLQKLERRTQRAIAEIIRERLKEGHGDLANTVNHVEV